MPGMMVGDNRFVYSDESTGSRNVRITHEWVERSTSRPPAAPAEGKVTDAGFEWTPAQDSDGDAIADYHFELSDREDFAWPLSSNFEKLISNTADRGEARYRLPGAGLLSPGRTYYWRVRAKDAKGVWGPWSSTWSFTASGPAHPLELSLQEGVLRWKPNPAGQKPARYRVYGSDEKGFSVSDKDNFVAETAEAELRVLGTSPAGSNRAFYRVLAVDDQGRQSGPSDYASSPRPFLTSVPLCEARVGIGYRYTLSTIRSLGDLRLRQVEGDRGQAVAKFWDTETPRYTLVKGPAWLKLDEKTGLLSGVPDATGNPEVEVTVTLERPVRVLDEARLSWGHEVPLEEKTSIVGSAAQRFTIAVSR
jgi:hypothetical protein